VQKRTPKAGAPKRGTGASSTTAVLARIVELERQVSLFHAAGVSYDEATARDQHTAVAFAFAEEAIRRKDLNVAVRVYRRLIEFYVGGTYSGIRDRARLGIDDVRESRRNVKAEAAVGTTGAQ
jgi:hypothetical protein